MCTFAFAQNSKVFPKVKIVPGEANTFVYQPAAGFNVPNDAFVKYLTPVNYRKTPLKKVKNQYEFIVKVPDSVRTVMMVVSNPKETFTDNNFGKGFTYYLKNNKDGKAEVDRLDLARNAEDVLKTKIVPETLVNEYETLFKSFPALKYNMFSYTIFLNFLKQTNPEKAKVFSEQYVKDLEAKGGDRSLTDAYYFYLRELQDEEKAEQFGKMILEKYPKGSYAKDIFVRNIYKEFEKGNKMDEQKIQNFLAELSQYPKDYYDKMLVDELYSQMLKSSIDERNWNKIDKATNTISDKFLASRVFNTSAWRIADGDNMISEGKDLDFAEKLARKSLETYYDKINNLGKYEDKSDYDQTFMYYTDALGMVLYKQKKYQEAFDEQSKLINFDFIDDSNLERYVLYAEKVKGTDFVKNYIFNLLKEKSISENLYNKLANIYKSQNISTSEIEKMREENKKIATKKAKQELIKLYGENLKAKDFALTNLEGKTVKLSDYRGKIVVLDFWATWCGPCREAMPHMQELVNQYKNQDVEFLFVNTLEISKPETTKKEVSKFITEKNYNFNVIFDYENEVSTHYKIQGIPCEIVIDKDGYIISRSEGYDSNLGALIQENL